ncbi:hypothetical protein BBJ28_00018924 [Nothophytophthora sp. Chile5]|nr:hypothetical protein BBJ28_00018924 [Nothophytophthora sp. Chile5]
MCVQFQVLESAREHFGLGETRQYQLLHRNKPIDLSIPFRLTGISNNAAVELKELEGALEVQQVRVCVQLRDGKRVQASFGNDTTIESILIFFKLLPASQNVRGRVMCQIVRSVELTDTAVALSVSAGLPAAGDSV